MYPKQRKNTNGGETPENPYFISKERKGKTRNQSISMYYRVGVMPPGHQRLRAKDDEDSRRKLVGTWICDVPNGDPVPFMALQTFHADGTFTETSSLLGRGEEGPAHGVWSRDDGKYRLTFQLFAFDPATGDNVGMIESY